ncbi:MAG: histidine kinase [Verrucomicrobiota bacterium]
MPIETVAIFPVHVEEPYSGKGTYGLPDTLRFEWYQPGKAIPIRTQTFTNPTPDQNRRGFPLHVGEEGVIASKLRMVVEAPWQGGESLHWALSEIMVLSGKRNIAAGYPVTIESQQGPEIQDVWFPNALTDSNNPLGPPVIPEASPSNGFLCNHTGNQNEIKWMQLDLGETQIIDEVRLFPSRPTDTSDLPGTGFPIRFKLEFGSDPEFRNPQIIFDTGEENFPNPGDSPVILLANGESARFVRLTATLLCPYARGYSFSLAEMEVWSGGGNVAAGALVTASDIFDNPTYPRWQPEYLVDGFASRNRIVPFDEWIEGLIQRGRLNEEILALRMELQTAHERVSRGSILIGTALLAIAGLLATAFFKSIRSRRLETARIRDQISRDLHDDVGSNLGGIALIADSLADAKEIPSEVRQEILEIRDVADTTSQSMRDIIWLIQEGDSSLEALVVRLKEIARRTLVGMDVEIEVLPNPLPEQELSLQVRRQIFLAFKEALHNVRKHADANGVQVKIHYQAEERKFAFVVHDDGCGFDEAMSPMGHGLENLERRASALDGSFKIKSSPEEGCRVEFSGLVIPSK